jgi:hypothetical protein
VVRFAGLPRGRMGTCLLGQAPATQWRPQSWRSMPGFPTPHGTPGRSAGSASLQPEHARADLLDRRLNVPAGASFLEQRPVQGRPPGWPEPPLLPRGRGHAGLGGRPPVHRLRSRPGSPHQPGPDRRGTGQYALDHRPVPRPDQRAAARCTPGRMACRISAATSACTWNGDRRAPTVALTAGRQVPPRHRSFHCGRYFPRCAGAPNADVQAYQGRGASARRVRGPAPGQDVPTAGVLRC